LGIIYEVSWGRTSKAREVRLSGLGNFICLWFFSALLNNTFLLLGTLCVCYSPKFDSWEKITYSVFYFHKGHSKTFTAALGSVDSHVTKGLTFLNLDYYVAVYLPGHFFHLLNIQHPDLICHSLFLTGIAVVFPSWTWPIWICLGTVCIWVRVSGVSFICWSPFFFGQETMKWSICYLIVLYSHSQGPWYWIGVLESSPGRSSTSRTYYSSYGTRSSTMRRWARCTVCSPGAETPRSWKPRWWCSFGLKTGK